MYRIGVDVGGTKINVGLFEDGSKRLIEVRKSYVAESSDIVELICGEIRRLLENNGVSLSELGFCGVGIPGTVSDDGKNVVKAPNLKNLPKNLPELLEDRLNIPVRMVQDSRAAAWGEYVAGAGIGSDLLVCVTLGTGIGTGIVIGGEIFAGASGSAGELGHLVGQENGRECGCGRRGCIEKYCAGGGLDITARELLGEGSGARELFERAKEGFEPAVRAVDDAVIMLGRGLLPIINLLSPDCFVFSGGLSEQEEQYLYPVIDYIRSHCYVGEREPIIKKAQLGEYSPLYGAAFISAENKRTQKNAENRRPQLSASIMCADIINMGEALREIEDAGIEYIHCDIMDNHFVPNLMIPMEFLNRLRVATRLPFDFHVMCEKPETVVERLDIREGDLVSIHYESTPHLHRVISLVRSKGARAAVAINPATPISVIEEILPEVEMVLVMSVDPGFAGQKIVPSSFDKIARLKHYLIEKGYEDILIEVDGCCSFENVPKMYDAGADIFVVGTSSVFKSGTTVKEGTEKLISLIEN